MTATLPPRARANTALAAGLPGTRIGYRTTRPPAPFYFPSKGAWFANRQIARRPKTILAARKKAAAWLDAHGPTASGFVFMADYWDALDAHIEARGGEMAIFLRYNH